MSEAQWYVGVNGQRQGPMSEADVKQLAASRKLAQSDMVWTATMPQWAPAGTVPGLFTASPMPLPPLGNSAAPVVAHYYTPPPPGQGAPGIGQDPGMRMLLPVGRSGWAIAAGYLGLLSFFPFVGPIAIIITIIAFRDMKQHPERHGMGRAITGLIGGIIGCVWTAAILAVRHW